MVTGVTLSDILGKTASGMVKESQYPGAVEYI
jgi:hypothetical protein